MATVGSQTEASGPEAAVPSAVAAVGVPQLEDAGARGERPPSTVTLASPIVTSVMNFSSAFDGAAPVSPTVAVEPKARPVRSDLSVANVRTTLRTPQFVPPSPTLSSSADLSVTSEEEDSASDTEQSPCASLDALPPPGTRVKVTAASRGPWLEGTVLSNRLGQVWVKPDGWQAASLFKHVKLLDS
eukprot:TRINITY_DN38887_c0_g1_i1.p1 TRINITY_DN38887_c0_g1~~TRINITY_DN38887_c0_g1_i1.p1  ORF type:complete len:213 (+),score=40.19 TRINITY_DN38887_c0_g1_i1:83-640(+)